MANYDTHAYVTPQCGTSTTDAQTQTEAEVGTNRARQTASESEPNRPLENSSTESSANNLDVDTVDTHVDDRANCGALYNDFAETGSVFSGAVYADSGVYTENGYLKSVAETANGGDGLTNLPSLDTLPEESNKQTVYESYLNPDYIMHKAKSNTSLKVVVLIAFLLLLIIIAILTVIVAIVFVKMKNDITDMRNENNILRNKVEDLEMTFNKSSTFTEALSSRLMNLENETLANQISATDGQNLSQRIHALENLKLDTRLEKIEDKNLTKRISTIEGENLGTRIWTLENLDIQTQLTSLEANFNYTYEQVIILEDFVSISDERLKNAELRKRIIDLNDTVPPLFDSLSATEGMVREIATHTSLGDNNLNNKKLKEDTDILNSSTSEITAEIDGLTKIFDELNDTLSKLEISFKSTNEIIHKFSTHISIEDSALTNRQLQNEIAQLNSSVLSRNDANCQNLNNTMVELQESVSTLTNDVNETRNDVNDNRQFIENLDSSTTNINSELSTLKRVVERSESRIEINDARIEILFNTVLP